MVFNSFVFAVFFALVFVVYLAPIGWRAKKAMLLIGSYGFYGTWNPPFVLLLAISTIVDWYVARALAARNEQRARRRFLALSILTNLGMLGYFKYGNFALENFTRLVEILFGWYPEFPEASIILPVGISFYTFQSMSYTLDVYFGKLKPSKSFLDFALFVSFFPQLVAGPIVRAATFLPQLESPRDIHGRRVAWGLNLLLLGLFMKIVVADALMAPASERAFDIVPVHGQTMLSAWTGVFAFSTQIYCDFAGYSACAIGVGMMLGFSLPDNFRAPYGAVGFADHWRRWHISLSSWLRDYLYIPLGGNRRGSFWTSTNMFITMLLGGLWHGAAWTFVVWGGYHGLLLALERFVKRFKFASARIWSTVVGRVFLAGVTFIGVNFSWAFFRAADFEQSRAMLLALFGVAGPLSDKTEMGTTWMPVFAITAVLFALHQVFARISLEEAAEKVPAALHVAVNVAMLVAILTLSGEDRAFIYFQF